MKHHETHRLRPVMIGTRYAGCLIYTAKGWTAHDAHDRPVGSYFAQPDAAVSKLRSLALEALNRRDAA
jgi:hypothetical protein